MFVVTYSFKKYIVTLQHLITSSTITRNSQTMHFFIPFLSLQMRRWRLRAGVNVVLNFVDFTAQPHDARLERVLDGVERAGFGIDCQRLVGEQRQRALGVLEVVLDLGLQLATNYQLNTRKSQISQNK